MRRVVARLVVVSFAASAAACVRLLSHSYYRPFATPGEVVEDRCWKTYDEIRFAQPETSIAVRVLERDPSRPVLRVTIRCPRDITYASKGPLAR